MRLQAVIVISQGEGRQPVALATYDPEKRISFAVESDEEFD